MTDEASAEGISPVPEQWLRVGFSGAGSKERLLFASSTVSRICAAGGIDRSLDRALQIRRLSRVSRSAEGAGNASRKPDLHCPGSRGNARAPVKPIGLRVTKSWRGYLGAREPPIDVKSYLWGVSGVETAGESIRSHWGAHSYQATRFE